MFSVEPIFERTFFRSGAEVFVARRLGLGVEGLVFAAVGFFSVEGAMEEREDMGTDLTLGATPAAGAAPETGGFFFRELMLLERLRSAGADFGTIFLTSAGLLSVLTVVSFLGTGVGELRLVGPVEARVAFGIVWVFLVPDLKV